MKTNLKVETRGEKSRLWWSLGLIAVLSCFITAAVARSIAMSSENMLAREQHVTLTIEPDGRCQLRVETVMSRDLAEKTVRMMEKFKKMQEQMADAEDSETKVEPTSTNAPVALSDTELLTKLRESATHRFGEEDAKPKPEPAVELQGGSVRVIATNVFASAAELAGGYDWHQLFWGFPMSALKLANETNGNLRLTLTPWTQRGAGSYLKSLTDQWKNAGVQYEAKIVMPGKILSSGFPETSDRTTSFRLDATNAANLQVFRAMVTTSIVIVAESGGLKLTEAVDSAAASRQRYGRQQNEFADLPLQPASPGYLAEADSAQVTTVYHFPEGTNLLKNRHAFDLETAGVSVRGKLFPPKGWSLLAVNNLKVTAARDDKGRKVESRSEDTEDYSGMSSAYVSTEREDPSAQLNLALKLPEPDAKAIEEVDVVAEVVMVASWKEMELKNVAARGGETVDISSVLQGAKLTFIQQTNKAGSSGGMRQFNMTLKLEGPRDIKSIKVECKASDDGRSNFSSYDSNSRTVKGINTREVRITGYSMFSEGGVDSSEVKIILRYPENPRREKVEFKLTGIDLL